MSLKNMFKKPKIPEIPAKDQPNETPILENVGGKAEKEEQKISPVGVFSEYQYTTLVSIAEIGETMKEIRKEIIKLREIFEKLDKN